MADIYENIVIGNFLFLLGHALGNRPIDDDPSVFSVNLLQQTPLDKTLGDVLMESSHFVRLIEFKRARNKSDKEAKKLELITDILQKDKNKHLLDVSREIHWYVETEYDGKSFASQALPYLDIFTQGACKFDLNDLIKSIVLEMTRGHISESERRLFKEYISTISMVQGPSGGSSGALALWADESGGLRYLPVSDIRYLSHTIENILQKECELSVQRQRLIDQQLELKPHRRGPGRTRGHERDGPSR